MRFGDYGDMEHWLSMLGEQRKQQPMKKMIMGDLHEDGNSRESMSKLYVGGTIHAYIHY